jgi:beta-lactamase regulating signal transducer with metallopeptidase domain
MLEFITRGLYHAGIHLSYASFVWVTAWLLTSLLRGSATTKYWIWVATSLNFIVPLGALFDALLKSRLGWATPVGTVGDVAAQVSRGPAAPLFAVLWFAGATIMFLRLGLRLQRERSAARTSDEIGPVQNFADSIPIRASENTESPAVGGLLFPHIALPRGIERLLSEHELNAVLIHELAHARRRDNLIRLVHEVAACALWFHPLVWITGRRLALYRELSCDEAVVAKAQGEELVSALAKLANPENGLLLQATATSFISHRLAGLRGTLPHPRNHAANLLLGAVFAAALAAGIFGTVSHTACCFVTKELPTAAVCRGTAHR